MNSVRPQHLLLAALIGLTASGCASASKFKCPLPNGVGCMSAREVYDATNDADTLEERGGKKAAASRKHGARGATTEYGAPTSTGVGAVIEDDSLRLVADGSAGPGGDGTVTLVPETEPMRLPAQVMRIWVSPYQDEAGDLHMPGYVLTEITSRRWAVGVIPPQEAPPLQLLTPPDDATPTASTTPTSSSPASSPTN